MPVYKYKTFDDADKALWNFNPDKEYYKRVEELFEFADKLSNIKYSKGVFKFKTFEEVNRHRDKIDLDHAINLRLK